MRFTMLALGRPASCNNLLSDNVHAADHDMIYLEPFKGTAEIRRYFDKVTSIVPGDLQFFVEDITDGDPRKVGVKWCAFHTPHQRLEYEIVIHFYHQIWLCRLCIPALICIPDWKPGTLMPCRKHCMGEGKPAATDTEGCVQCVVWLRRHVQLNGFEFPFSRGASFYEVTDAGQILYGRDLVEPALKPGSSALFVCSPSHCAILMENSSQLAALQHVCRDRRGAPAVLRP